MVNFVGWKPTDPACHQSRLSLQLTWSPHNSILNLVLLYSPSLVVIMRSIIIGDPAVTSKLNGGELSIIMNLSIRCGISISGSGLVPTCSIDSANLTLHRSSFPILGFFFASFRIMRLLNSTNLLIDAPTICSKHPFWIIGNVYLNLKQPPSAMVISPNWLVGFFITSLGTLYPG